MPRVPRKSLLTGVALTAGWRDLEPIGGGVEPADRVGDLFSVIGDRLEVEAPSGEQAPKAKRLRRKASDRLTDVVGAVRVPVEPVSSAHLYGPPLGREPGDIVVDLIRPADLLQLTVLVRGAVLVKAQGDQPAHVRADTAATMVVGFPFQHAHEQALYEQAGSEPDSRDPRFLKGDPKGPQPPEAPAPPDVEPLPSPVDFRPARGTRLAFAIPAGEGFPFTTAGILAAMSRYDMIVAPLALPAQPKRVELPDFTIGPGTSVLVGDLIATVRGSDVSVSAATAAERRLLTEAASTVTGAAQASELLRRVRASGAASRVVVNEGVAAASVRDAFGLVVSGRFRPEFVFPPSQTFSAPPGAGVTAIEAPFRLIVSPSVLGRWVHATDPVPARNAPGHVELWHSRLAVAPEDPDAEASDDPAQRVIRALWTRDRDSLTPAEWQDKNADRAANGPLNTKEEPTRGSLNRADRHRLVRQTSERWRRGVRGLTDPEPVPVDKLWLTPLGAYLDVHGRWSTLQYSAEGMNSVLSWDHIAPLGRDQFVRVTYPGFLYPTGHKAVLVKITERKIRGTKPVAALYQRKFIVVTEPVRLYGRPRVPFTRVEVRPVVTPDLADPPVAVPDEPMSEGQDRFFWPRIGSTLYTFELRTKDRDGEESSTHAPLLWVAESWGVTQKERDDLDAFYIDFGGGAPRTLSMDGQQVAFAPRFGEKDAKLETNSILLRGHAIKNGADEPSMTSAEVVVPAAQRMTGTKQLRITYEAAYRDEGFGDGEPTRGGVWARTVLPGLSGDPAYKGALFSSDPAVALPEMAFGPTPTTPGQPSTGAPTAVGSDKGGGFVQPNLAVRGLSVVQGVVGDVDSAKTSTFDAKKALDGILPRLFGLVDLIELLPLSFDELPDVVTETLGKAMQFANDVAELARRGQDLVDQAQEAAAAASGAEAAYRQKLTDAAAKAEVARAQLAAAADQVAGFFADLAAIDPTAIDPTVVTTDFEAIVPGLAGGIDALSGATQGMPPLVRGRIDALISSIRPFLDDAAKTTAMIAEIVSTFQKLAALAQDMRFRYDWKPPMKSWDPVGGGLRTLDFHEQAPALAHPLTIAIEGRLPAAGDAQVEVLAEIKDFDLNLIPGAELIQLPFERIAFRASSKGKAEVDVVLGDIRFLGILEFINDLKDLIPFDGFSDPPYLDVSPEGIKAGYSLALPNLAVGVFNLSNISLGADVRVPFLGSMVTVGFNFCTREKPLVLSVMFLGGGGFFGLRLSPERVELLELSLEAGAYLSVDFGVASGSISAAIGIYIRMEADTASLTGYVRLRGEVDVLGLISASIELYLEMTYIPDTGKMFGRAVITVTVEVFIFSGTVKIEAERQFAGSNGDPSWADMYLEGPAKKAPAWDQYLDAFAAEAVPA